MKFFITKAFLVALTFGVGSSAEKTNLNGRDERSRREDADFWKSIMLEDVDSMAKPTNKPSAKPIDPTPVPVDPTPAPVVPTPAPSKVKPISDAPSGGPTPDPPTTIPFTSEPSGDGPSSPPCQSIGMC